MRGEPGSGPLCDGHSSPTRRLQLQTWAPGRCFLFLMKVSKRLSEKYCGYPYCSFHISKTQSNPTSS